MAKLCQVPHFGLSCDGGTSLDWRSGGQAFGRSWARHKGRFDHSVRGSDLDLASGIRNQESGLAANGSSVGSVESDRFKSVTDHRVILILPSNISVMIRPCANRLMLTPLAGY